MSSLGGPTLKKINCSKTKKETFFQQKFETECVTAKSEVQNLSGKVRNLESVLDEMHKAAENRREIERQHKEALVSCQPTIDVTILVKLWASLFISNYYLTEHWPASNPGNNPATALKDFSGVFNLLIKFYFLTKVCTSVKATYLFVSYPT